MLWIKAFHIIFMVMWFSGLFYLPRLFVYHALATDRVSIERFKVMEKKLYYFIMTPAGIITILLGVLLMSENIPVFMQMVWLHIKLSLVLLLMMYHFYLGMLLHAFLADRNKHSHLFYRILNEIPAVALIAIVILAVVKPFGMLA